MINFYIHLTSDFVLELDSPKIQLSLPTSPFGFIGGISHSKHSKLNPQHLFLFGGLLSIGEELLRFSLLG